MSVTAQIESFIVTEIAAGRGIESLPHDEDLLASEVIDSLGIMQLISFLEASYGISVSDEDLDPEHFRSIDAIASFVESKQRV